VATKCAYCGKPFEPPPKNQGKRTCSRSCAVAISWRDPVKAEKRIQSLKRVQSTPEAIQRTVDANNRRWAQLGEREKLADRNRRDWADPEHKSKRSAAIKEARNRPEQREKYSRMRTEQWTDPEYRQKVTDAVNAAYQKPEVKKKLSGLLSARWQDPVWKLRQIAVNGMRKPRGNRRISPEKLEQLRDGLRQGLSIRQIARLTGVNRGTVNSYCHIFRADAPMCEHGVRIYQCSICGGARRELVDGVLVMKHGPQKRNIKTLVIDETPI